MLYTKFRGTAAPLAMTNLQELDTFCSLPAHRRLLWIHFETSYSWGRSTTVDLDASYRSYIGSLRRWSEKNGKLVWTVHDEGLHLNDSEQSRIQDIRARLRDMADCVHVHSEAAKTLVVEKFGVAADRVFIARHPSYAPLYADAKSADHIADLARRRRLLCFGQLQPYKDYQGLGTALDTLTPGSFEALTIAGQLNSGVVLPEETYRRNLHLDLQLGFIPDEAVSKLFANAHFLVLPYTESLTSGAAALSMGFGVPVIAPDLGGMREAVPEECLPLIYSPEDPNGLTTALRTARDMTPETYRNLAESCRAFGAAIHPDQISRALRRFLSENGIFD
jgi:glycosyltransferase involved in cell wall biosynthesis